MHTPDPTPRKRLALGSAAIGAAAVLGSLLVFSGGAGAQDAPELNEPTATATVEADAVDAEGTILELGDDMVILNDAFDADFAAYDECVENQLGIDFETADEAAWEGLTDDAWMAADEACEDQLPQEIRDMNAAWEKYDDCLAENGIDFGDEAIALEDIDNAELTEDFGAAVFVEDGENFTVAEFGDADGTITITQTDGEIVVSGDGDVEILDESAFDFEVDEEWEAAHAACEGELPEDAFFGEGEWLEGDDLELFEFGEDAIEVPADA